MRSLLLFFFAFLIWNSSGKVKRSEGDAEVDWQTVLDDQGIPDFYVAHVKTPVCEESQCYDIEVLLQFDLTGQFLGLDTLAGKGLTKLDHIPFTDGDYRQLQYLLMDERSPLGRYEMEALITDTRNSELDGFTGATILEIRDIVVDGGVYSCFTLWNLVHRNLKFITQERTKALFDNGLIRKMASYKEERYYYFIINNLASEQWLLYEEALLPLLTFDQGYFLKNAFEKMPVEFLENEVVQIFFAKRFAALNYFAQVAFLKRLDGVAISWSLHQALQRELNASKTLKNQLIEALLD